nr:MAG: RNA-dependent RNA polymerase [Riboviria sp.]
MVFHQSKTRVYNIVHSDWGYKVSTHSSCICNEQVSLHNRHLIDRSYLKYNSKCIKYGFKLLNKLYSYKSGYTNYLDLVNSYSGKKKKSYYRAWKNLLENGLQKKHAVINMFVKPDRLPEEVIKDKAPRAIQYRRPEFNLKYMHYFKAFENHFIENFKYNSRNIAKGLNNRQRAELVVQKLGNFVKPKFLNIDHSKFDSTVNKHHLKYLHKFYRKCCPKGIYNLTKLQRKGIGYTKHGIKYRVNATRCSGDPDTGTGNSIINIACLLYVFRNCKFDFILDGDDAVVIMEATDVINYKDF